NFYNFLVELCEGNYENSTRYLNKLSRTLIPDKKYLNFKKRSREIFAQAGNKKIKEFQFSHKIMSLFRAAAENGMTFDKNLYPLLKALIRLEEMAYRTLPEAFFVKDLRNELRRYEDSI
ncbi:MAG: hypothetical protein ACRC5B_01895, partial [Fusobacteriaceae bacterium]